MNPRLPHPRTPWLAALVGASLFAALSGSAAGVLAAASGAGRLVATSGGALAEELQLDQSVAVALAALDPGEALSIAEWPWAPGERIAVELARQEIYAPEARIIAVTVQGLVELPRAPLRFFWGPTARGGGERLLVELDPATLRLRARSYGEAGDFELLPPDEESGPFRLAAVPAAPEPGSWSCGQQSDPLAAAQGTGPGAAFAAPAAPELITTLHTATVAVDTDNELMLQKFSDNTASATTYLAQLFAAINVIYERDLLVRLLQGTTFLRLSSVPDPYNQTGSGASPAQLNEFSNYWSGGCGGTCTGVTRALAMLLSGKSSNPNSSSGIAWLDALCSTSIGYSFSQVFKFSGATGASDAFVVGHELGHNFGSPHTHCYSPPIDNCYAAESGCFSGTTSCPAASTINGVPNVRGTLMSYCHLLGGCSASQVFHSRTVNEQIGPLVQSRVGSCVFPFDPFAAGFRDGFEGGLVPPWSGKRP